MAVVEISGSSVTTVHVVEVAAAIGRFPHTAADRTQNRLRCCHCCGRRRIDGNGVNSPFSCRVIKTARTTRHPQWLRTECGKIGRTQRVWIGEIKLQMLSRWDAGSSSGMLSRSSAHPCRIEAAGRICQTVMPVLFQLCQTSSFALCTGARYRHVALGLRGTRNCSLFTGEYGKGYPGQAEESVRAAYED